MLIFDIETDGFYDVVTTLHCLVIYDTELKVLDLYSSRDPAAMEAGIRRVMDTGAPVVGHNVLKYDIPVLKKLYPWFERSGPVIDTLILTRLLFPETGEQDDKLIAAGKLPAKHRGAHKLEAWGYRLGILKGEFDGPWEVLTQEMLDYCVQDVRVTKRLLDYCHTRPIPQEAVDIEHAVANILVRQERHGFWFDEPAALRLLATLSKEKLRLADDLKARFGWWWARDGAGSFTPKKDLPRLGYTGGAPLTKVKQVYFNPASRDHIARVLTKQFGWKASSLTPTGKPEVSEESLKDIKHPEAKTLIDYLTVDKRLGQLADGKEAWLKHAKNGRIHGQVNQLGTVTGRMSHSFPNVAQVPRVSSPWGKECRSLFGAGPGKAQVGIDASGLEARNLAHYMALYDGGAYVKTVTEGTKEEGTEIHSVNMRALGIDSRDDAKTWFYAFMYGAGDSKLGKIITKSNKQRANAKLGKELRARFLANMPALDKLIKAVKAKARANKYLRGLDGRPLYVRSDHAALNTLLQSAGAVVMKKALLLFDSAMQTKGLVPGKDYEFVANVHDEWQVECRPELAEEIGRLGVEAIREAGRHFRFRCPLDGDFSTGATWADTH